MEKITWRTQRKYFQEFNIIYSNSAIAFEMVWRRVSGSSNFSVAIGKQSRIGLVSVSSSFSISASTCASST